MKLKDYFNKFIEYKQKVGLDRSTISEYRRFLGEIAKSSLAEKKIKDLVKNDYIELLELGKIHGDWGEQRIVSVYRQLLQYLDDSGITIPFNYLRIKLPSVPDREQDYITEPEFEEFVSQIPTNKINGLRDRVFFEVLWCTGMRLGEALSLNISSINFEEKKAKIITEKSGDEGFVYFSERCLYWIKKYLEARKRFESEALFISLYQCPQRMQSVSIRKSAMNYRKKMGTKKKITCHSFRRGFATHLIESGANIKEVQYLCRHKSERTTLKTYVKFNKLKTKDTHHRIFDGIKFDFLKMYAKKTETQKEKKAI